MKLLPQTKPAQKQYLSSAIPQYKCQQRHKTAEVSLLKSSKSSRLPSPYKCINYRSEGKDSKWCCVTYQFLDAGASTKNTRVVTTVDASIALQAPTMMHIFWVNEHPCFSVPSMTTQNSPLPPLPSLHLYPLPTLLFSLHISTQCSLCNRGAETWEPKVCTESDFGGSLKVHDTLAMDAWYRKPQGGMRYIGVSSSKPLRWERVGRASFLGCLVSPMNVLAGNPAFPSAREHSSASLGTVDMSIHNNTNCN